MTYSYSVVASPPFLHLVLPPDKAVPPFDPKPLQFWQQQYESRGYGRDEFDRHIDTRKNSHNDTGQPSPAAYAFLGNHLLQFEVDSSSKRKRLRECVTDDYRRVRGDCSSIFRPLTSYQVPAVLKQASQKKFVSDNYLKQETQNCHQSPLPQTTHTEDLGASSRIKTLNSVQKTPATVLEKVPGKVYDKRLVKAYGLKEIVARLVPFHVYSSSTGVEGRLHRNDGSQRTRRRKRSKVQTIPSASLTGRFGEELGATRGLCQMFTDIDERRRYTLMLLREQVCEINQAMDHRNTDSPVAEWVTLRLLTECVRLTRRHS